MRRFAAVEPKAKPSEKLRLQSLIHRFRDGLQKIKNHQEKVEYLLSWKRALKCLNNEVSEYELYHIERLVSMVDALIEHHGRLNQQVKGDGSV